LPRTARRRLAFTMVEVLLALGIFSMVLVSIYATWSAIMRGTKIAHDAAAAVQRSRVAVKAVEDALTTAQIYQASPSKYWFEVTKEGEFSQLTLTSRLPDTFPGSGLYGGLGQRLRLVKFVVKPGPDSKPSLMLYQKPVLEGDGSGYSNLETYYKITLSRNIDLFTLEMWDKTKKEWVDEWIERKTNTIPELVRITIGMGNKDNTPAEQREIITRVIAPSAMVVPEVYQRGGAGLPPGIQPTRATPSIMPNPPATAPPPF
jgi:type II secretory pathway pseudopilin PulG